MEYSSEQLNEIYNKLPDDLKDAVFSVESANVVEEVGKKYKLHIDQIGNLGSEVGYTLLGVTHYQDFVGNLEKRVGVDRFVATQIGEEISAKIFSKVRETLRKIHEEKKTQAGQKIETKPATENPLHPANILRGIENPKSLGVPTDTLNILTGKKVEALYPANGGVKTTQSTILGFTPAINIMERKMEGGLTLPTKQNILGDKKEQADPYREAI